MPAHWFAVKTFYCTEATGRPEKPDRHFDPDATLLEDRTLLFKATHLREAVTKAEKEAAEYAKRISYVSIYGQNVTMRYIKLYEVFDIDSDKLGNGTELFLGSRLVHRKTNNNKIAQTYINKQSGNDQGRYRKFLNAEYHSFES